jgi:hypothetical protein
MAVTQPRLFYSLIVIFAFVTLWRTPIRKFLSHAVCDRKMTPSLVLKSIGRLQSQYPAPFCTSNPGLIKMGRIAVLTTLRTNIYFSYVLRLHCSLSVTNPNVKLIVATVKGDISNEIEDAIKQLENVQLVFWDELRYENKLSARFAYNWFKIRAWSMTDYDSLLMIDGDTQILGDITHLFQLPTQFAAVLDEDKTGEIYSSLGSMQGGVILLRPCARIAEHMISLLRDHPHLRFTKNHAEQDFFDWYFRYNRFILPTTYNSIRHLLDENNNTRGGEAPVIVHYTSKKPNFKFQTPTDKLECLKLS